MFSNELTCNILDYLNSNINKEITIDELSLKYNYNKTYIMKRFKKELNISIHEYINISRIYNCLYYFENDNYFLNIGFRNGFNSLEYFSETFKKIMGVSPTIYKKYVNKMASKREEDIITNNLIKINNIKEKITKYLYNRKPDYNKYVKKYSLNI